MDMKYVSWNVNGLRACVTKGFVDAMLSLDADAICIQESKLQEGIYSWWSYRFHASEKNAGWRIDYFLTSESLKDRLVDATIETEILGSDHCPVTLTIA